MKRLERKTIESDAKSSEVDLSDSTGVANANVGDTRQSAGKSETTTSKSKETYIQTAYGESDNRFAQSELSCPVDEHESTDQGQPETSDRGGMHAPAKKGRIIGNHRSKEQKTGSVDSESGSQADSKPLPDNDARSQVTTQGNISWKLFVSFLRIGLFTFGGGYAMIPLIQREVTVKNRWVEPSRFLELLTLAQSAPGPISLNTAVFVGYNMNRYKGAAAAILGVIVPSFVILLLIAIYFADIKDNAIVEAVFKGMRPAVVALIAAPLLGFTKGMGAYRIGVALLVAAAIWRLSVSPAWFIAAGAAAGLIWAYFRKRKEARQ